MKMKINGTYITLDKMEVKSAKRVVAKFFKNIDTLAKERHQPTYYFTLLIVAHLMSQEALNNIDEKNLAMIMNRLNLAKEETRPR